MSSWFTDLAEKAESLLVAVDQTAAGALHTTPKKKFEEPVLPVVITSTQKPLHLPTSLNVQKSSSPVSRQKRPSNIIEDDQLLSYLNSPSEPRTFSKSEEVRRLENQLIDLRSTLGAKDSQLAVLRVRLQEADQDLSAKKSLIDELTTENESLMKDNNSGSTNVTLQSLREQLREADAELKSKQELFRATQTELQAKLRTLEMDNKRLSQELSAVQQQFTKDKLQRKELEGQLQLATSSLDGATTELQDYKQRAQMILQSKDKLISSLRDGGGCGPREAEQELEAVRSELELARQEGENLRQSLTQMEAVREAERQMWYDQRSQLESRLQEETQAQLRAELESQQALKELEVAREHVAEVRVELEAQLQAKVREMERLTAKLSVRPRPPQHPQLELKVQQLTESLIKKQTVVETLASDKNSLLLQVERLEQQLAESLRYQESLLREPRKPRSHSFRPAPPLLYPDSPYDSLPTRVYKRTCRSLDSLNFHLGLFYNKYPLSRALIFLYLLILQVWAVALMFHYQPS